jgi:hypothetical protein
MTALICNNKSYCPLCLSDIEKDGKDYVPCQNCGIKVYPTGGS